MLLHYPLECSRRCSLQHHGGAASTHRNFGLRTFSSASVPTCSKGPGVDAPPCLSSLALFEVSGPLVLLGAVLSALCVGVKEEHSQERYSIGKSGPIGGDSARRLLNEC